MRLADMGARVIKVERPGSGDSGRKMTLENLVVGKDSMNFLAINRGKESFCANMKDPEDLKILKALIKKADVMIENFRPGVMKKNGLDYASVSQWNPGIVYATVTGYGQEGPWKTKPGQDLLIQSMSGLAWLNGNGGDPPAPFGLSVVDSYAGTHMAEGILAALIRRTKTC
jgi:crotonobetainyl-CoA:carnitine CoA-transferase CaiB-like acyl-CoA transferase